MAGVPSACKSIEVTCARTIVLECGQVGAVLCSYTLLHKLDGARTRQGGSSGQKRQEKCELKVQHPCLQLL